MHYGSQSVEGFLAGVASEEVTPAGGTVAAVVGAAGASLCEMVCIHTMEADRDADVASELEGARDDLRRQRGHLLELADADADAVEALLRAFRDGADDADTARAAGVPLAIAEGCLTVLEHATVVTADGNPTAVPDAVTGAFLAHAALRAAAFTVRSNLEHVEDPSFAEEVRRRVADAERSAERALEEVLEHGERAI